MPKASCRPREPRLLSIFASTRLHHPPFRAQDHLSVWGRDREEPVAGIPFPSFPSPFLSPLPPPPAPVFRPPLSVPTAPTPTRPLPVSLRHASVCAGPFLHLRSLHVPLPCLSAPLASPCPRPPRSPGPAPRLHLPLPCAAPPPVHSAESPANAFRMARQSNALLMSLKHAENCILMKKKKKRQIAWWRRSCRGALVAERR